MHLLLAALFAAPAHAADLILSWNYEEFPDGDDLSGTDGWSSGYDADPWYGYLSSSSGRTYALPQTDANSSDSPGSWGAGGAIDNFLVNRDVKVEDGELRTYFYTYDNDSMGLIFNQTDARNYYLALLVGDGGDSPLGDTGPYTKPTRRAPAASAPSGCGWTTARSNSPTGPPTTTRAATRTGGAPTTR